MAYEKSDPTLYEAQCAKDAATSGYGGPSYAAYLDESSKEKSDHYVANGNPDRADEMMVRSLAEALRGNDGE